MSSEAKTIAERLDAAKTGEEFGQVLGGLFTALERARDDEESTDRPIIGTRQESN